MGDEQNQTNTAEGQSELTAVVMGQHEHLVGIEFLHSIAIRHGSDNHMPCAVYVSGISATFEGTILSNEININNILFGGTFEKFNYTKLAKMQAEWKVENAKRSVARFEKNLKDLGS